MAEDKPKVTKETTKARAKSSLLPKVLMLIIIGLIGYLVYAQTQSSPDTNKDADTTETAQDVDVAQAAEDAQDPAKWSYAFGHVMGRDIVAALSTFSEGPEVDNDAIVDAVRDALNDNDPGMSDSELQAIIQQRIKLEQDAIKVRGEANKESGAAFFEEYKGRDGVVVADNGSLYRVLVESSGDVVGENVATAVYTGKHIDGEVFDSTAKNGGVPAQFVREGVIPGLGDVLAQMRQGDKWEIVIPSENAYGPNGIPGVILPHETLVFEIEIVGISPRPEAVPAADVSTSQDGTVPTN